MLRASYPATSSGRGLAGLSSNKNKIKPYLQGPFGGTDLPSSGGRRLGRLKDGPRSLGEGGAGRLPPCSLPQLEVDSLGCSLVKVLHGGRVLNLPSCISSSFPCLVSSYITCEYTSQQMFAIWLRLRTGASC